MKTWIKKNKTKKKPTSFEQDFRALKQQPDGGVCRKTKPIQKLKKKQNNIAKREK